MALLDIDLSSLVFIGMTVMLLLFGSFLFAIMYSQKKKLRHQRDMQALQEQQQNQLIEAAVRSEEIERHRIAETLHDEVGAILSSTKLHFQGMKIENMNDRDLQLYSKGKELLDEGIQKVRGISHNLHSNILKEFGLNEALHHFIATLTNGSILTASAELDATYNTQNPEKDISIYRLIQELLNNILKHSGAQVIRITSKYQDALLHFEIIHDGKGLTQDQFEILRYNKDGLGLKNIQNRIILLKGTIQFFLEESQYHTIIDIPIQSNV